MPISSYIEGSWPFSSEFEQDLLGGENEEEEGQPTWEDLAAELAGLGQAQAPEGYEWNWPETYSPRNIERVRKKYNQSELISGGYLVPVAVPNPPRTQQIFPAFGGGSPTGPEMGGIGAGVGYPNSSPINVFQPSIYNMMRRWW